MSNHTPGPWIADDNEGFSAWSIWSGSAPSGYGNGIKIATVNGDSEESDANARLIAAAPRLFEALEDLLAQAKQYTHMQVLLQDEIDAAETALAIARGEVPSLYEALETLVECTAEICESSYGRQTERAYTNARAAAQQSKGDV